MSNSNKGNCNKDGGQRTVTRVVAMAMPTMRAMATATRLAGNDERKGKGGKGKCNGDEGGGR